MQIPDNALDEFIEIYKNEFGQTLTRVEAQEVASDLLALYGLLSRRLPGEERSTQGVTRHDDAEEDRPKIGFRA